MTPATGWTDLVLQGVSDIAAGFPVGGLSYSPQVAAAINAGLAYDSDPTYWASDMNIGRSAALTETGFEVARARGLLVGCACTGCNREANPGVCAYCRSCQVRGNREGWINGEQCYDHYLPSHPEVAAARVRLLTENSTRGRGQNRYDWEKRHRYEEALSYIDPGHERVKDFR